GGQPDNPALDYSSPLLLSPILRCRQKSAQQRVADDQFGTRDRSPERTCDCPGRINRGGLTLPVRGPTAQIVGSDSLNNYKLSHRDKPRTQFQEQTFFLALVE